MPDLEFTPTGDRIESAEQFNKLLSTYLKSNFAITPKGRQKGTYKLSENDRSRIYQLHRDGFTNRKIAELYDVSEKTIRNYLKMNKK